MSLSIRYSTSVWFLPLIIDARRIAIVCELVSADTYRVGTCILSANASAKVDLPTPGTPANIETSARRQTILFVLNVLNTAGKGSPPMSERPTLLTNVLTENSCLKLEEEQSPSPE